MHGRAPHGRVPFGIGRSRVMPPSSSPSGARGASRCQCGLRGTTAPRELVEGRSADFGRVALDGSAAGGGAARVGRAWSLTVDRMLLEPAGGDCRWDWAPPVDGPLQR
jgi:hypothetical protein